MQDGPQDHGEGARRASGSSCASSRSSKLVDRLVFSKVRARFGGRLKYAFSGGAALSREVAEFIDSLGITVYEGYGLTETSPIATANLPGARKIGSVGRPIPGVRVEIDPATGENRPTPDGKGTRFEGEIVVYGHNVMKGYLKRPEENAAVFTKDGGFRTGDMGYVDPQGFLFITGRIKEQYKLENGKYVVPTPLEEALKLSPYVANAMVYGDNRPFNVALVVANVPAVRKWAESEHVRLPNDDEGVLEGRARAGALQGRDREARGAFKGFESIRDFALIADGLHDRQRHAHAEPEAQAPEGRRDLRRRSSSSCTRRRKGRARRDRRRASRPEPTKDSRCRECPGNDHWSRARSGRRHRSGWCS